VSYAKFDTVTELQGRVPANRHLVYGKRYATKPGESEPLPDTVERFVAEVEKDGEVLEPTAELFEDRRVLVLDLDEVEGLRLEGPDFKVEGKKDGFGKWTSPDKEIPAESLNNVLWTLKDLRFSEKMDKAGAPEKAAYKVDLRLASGPDSSLRFGLGENGKPYLWRDSHRFLLSERSWKAWQDAVAKLNKREKVGKEEPQ
jgi:hypothetical protein